VLLAVVVAPMRVAVAGSPDAVEQARAFHELGETQRAVELLQPYLETAPTDVAALKLMSELMVATNQPNQALALLKRLRRLTPNDPDVLADLATAMEAAGHLEHAAMITERILARDPTDANSIRRLIQMYKSLGRPVAAAAAMDRLVELAPQPIEVLRELAELREHLRHWRDARAHYEDILTMAPGDAAVLRKIAQLSVLMEDDESALRAYTLAAPAKSGDIDGLRGLASVYGWRDDSKGRVRALRALLHHAPNDLDARDALAFTLLGMGRDQAAAAEWDALLVRLPLTDGRQVGARVRAALIHQAYDDYDKALEYLEYVALNDPARPGTTRALAMVHDGRGDKPMAIEMYRRLLVEDPGDPSLRKVLQDLEISIAPRISGRYELEQSRLQERQVGRVWFEHEPTKLIRYRAGYVFAFAQGDSFIENRTTLQTHSHGGFAGLTLRLGPRTLLDFLANANGYVEGPGNGFVGGRIKFSQEWHNFEYRTWVARREDFSTMDAVTSNTVVHDLHLEFDWNVVGPWSVGAGGSIGHWRHTDVRTLQDIDNRGYDWYARTGLGILEDPVSLEVSVEYTGESFVTTSEGTRIPYFAPDLYQTIGAELYLEQKPTWWLRYALHGSPQWIFKDEALQIVYGAELDFKFHPRHWLELRFDRTDTAVGETDVIFNENRIMATYTGVF